jgi:hypothetical protein
MGCSCTRDYASAQKQLLAPRMKEKAWADQNGDRNDEILERIYIGRRCKNDTVRSAFPQGKRLEKRFELHTKMRKSS